MPHRSPTRHDIGKTVEVRKTLADEWQVKTLDYIVSGREGSLYYVDRIVTHAHCRVPYNSPDPIAEFHYAVDLLVDNGMDEAARALMVYMSLSNEDKQRLNAYRTGDILNLWQISS